MINVTDIDEAKPHLTICGLEKVHVVPLSLINDMAAGRIKITDVEEVNDFLPAILLDMIENYWSDE